MVNYLPAPLVKLMQITPKFLRRPQLLASSACPATR